MADVTPLTGSPTAGYRTAKYRFSSPHGMVVAVPLSLALWAVLWWALRLIG